MSPARVTLLLAAIGATVGFLLGSVLLAVLQMSSPGGFHWDIDPWFGMTFGGTFGALVGGLGAPLLSWLFLREVPLGRAILGTTISSVVGAALGTLASGHTLTGGCAGFVIGALILKWAHRRRKPVTLPID